MRDILTVLAGLLILVLAAALVVPPFVEWEAHRERIELALAQAAGTPVKTEGRLELRLLPSPRVRLDQLRLGSGRADAPALLANFVKAEIALTGLFQGDVRFTATRIGRAELRVPTAADGSWRLPPEIGSGEALGRRWAFEDLRVQQLLVTTVTPTTGRTDQFFAENVRVEGQTLAGPWRLEGATAGVPFRLATGEIGPDRTVAVKLAGGGDLHPRFEVDGKLALAGAEGEPGLSGTAKLLFGPPAQVAAAGVPVPVAILAGFKTAGKAVELDPISIEAGEGTASLRLSGTGTVRIDDPSVSLKLEGRRLDIDSFILSAAGQAFREQMPSWSLPPIAVPIDLDLSLGSIGLAQEELSNFVLRAGLRSGRAEIRLLELTAPGQTRIAVEGELGLTTEGGGNGRIAVATPATDRFLRYLARLSIPVPFARAIEAQPLEARADVSFAPPVASFRNLRLKLGEASVTGTARFTAPEGQARGKLEAQVGIQGLDLAQLPQIGSVFEATRNLDVGFILDARGVRHGGRDGAGRISARILSDGPSLFVEALEIVDLAGANARVSGRIGPDGSGRIAGRVTAKRAAPLVDLLGTVWVGGVSQLVPHFLREGDLDLEVTAERAGEDQRASGPRLRTSARGRAAGGLFEAEAVAADGRTESLAVRLATENTGVWVDRPNVPILRRPSKLELKGVRVASGLFNVTAEGEVGGVRVHTTRPFALGSGDDVVDSGEAALSTPDVTPFLVLLGDGAGVDPPVPMDVRVTLGRERDGSLLAIGGRIADGAVQARLAARSRADITGTIAVDRLSMPWLVAALALNAAPDPRASLWSTARFGQSGRLVHGGQVAVQAKAIEFGRGFRGANGAFTFAIMPEGVAIRDLAADLAAGRLKGALTITRQGSLASFVGEGAVENVPLDAALGPSPFAGRLSGNLRFGSSGETLAATVGNLAGAGELRLSELRVPNAEPGALARGLPRALADNDPLSARRLQAILGEELAKGRLQAPAVASPITMVGGVMRMSPFAADPGPAVWQGAVAVDLKTLSLDARGTLTSRTAPKGWSGTPPYVGLAWRGPMASPAREIDVGPLINGLASIVLQRELERIEAFEMEANERARLNSRRGMEQMRERDRLAAEEAARQARIREEQEAAEAARQARLREEAERQARIREQQEADRQARLREEAERQARIREQREAERQARIREEAERQARMRQQEDAQGAPSDARFRPGSIQPLPAPLDIRPPAALGRPPG
ncbi:MAG: AsmA family protein [Microvirga sp.]|nr:AsmA family protein [Microvirga sp.]